MLNGGARPGSGAALKVDLNCDMGEGMPGDEAIFPFISSANIACGGHAGDENTMRHSVELAMRHAVAVGAHPSYPDWVGFGRDDILETAAGKGDRPLSFVALHEDLIRQLGALYAVCRELGADLHHVKPHGALYNRAAKDPAVAALIAAAVSQSGHPSLLFYGLSGSMMEPAAADVGLRFVSEVFADRSYRPDGSLTPRSEPDALIRAEAAMLEQALSMVRKRQVCAVGGTLVPLRADTICLHGDGAHAAQFARTLRRELDRCGIVVAAP